MTNLRLHVLAAALLAGGCETSDDPGTDAGASVSCLAAESHSDFTWLEANIFQPSCGAFSACHKGAATDALGLNLEAGLAYDSLVGQPSLAQPGRQLVAAGDPAGSYLLVALGHRAGPLPPGGTMPLNNPLLCEPKLEAVERWIAAGAAR